MHMLFATRSVFAVIVTSFVGSSFPSQRFGFGYEHCLSYLAEVYFLTEEDRLQATHLLNLIQEHKLSEKELDEYQQTHNMLSAFQNMHRGSGMERPLPYFHVWLQRELEERKRKLKQEEVDRPGDGGTSDTSEDAGRSAATGGGSPLQTSVPGGEHPMDITVDVSIGRTPEDAGRSGTTGQASPLQTFVTSVPGGEHPMDITQDVSLGGTKTYIRIKVEESTDTDAPTADSTVISIEPESRESDEGGPIYRSPTPPQADDETQPQSVPTSPQPPLVIEPQDPNSYQCPRCKRICDTSADMFQCLTRHKGPHLSRLVMCSSCADWMPKEDLSKHVTDNHPDSPDSDKKKKKKNANKKRKTKIPTQMLHACPACGKKDFQNSRQVVEHMQHCASTNEEEGLPQHTDEPTEVQQDEPMEQVEDEPVEEEQEERLSHQEQEPPLSQQQQEATQQQQQDERSTAVGHELPEESPPSKKRRLDPAKDMYKCKECGLGFPGYSEVMQHRDEQHPEKSDDPTFVCEQCDDLRFPELRDLLTHRKNIHPEKKTHRKAYRNYQEFLDQRSGAQSEARPRREAVDTGRSSRVTRAAAARSQQSTRELQSALQSSNSESEELATGVTVRPDRRVPPPKGAEKRRVKRTPEEIKAQREKEAKERRRRNQGDDPRTDPSWSPEGTSGRSTRSTTRRKCDAETPGGGDMDVPQPEQDKPEKAGDDAEVEHDDAEEQQASHKDPAGKPTSSLTRRHEGRLPFYCNRRGCTVSFATAVSQVRNAGGSKHFISLCYY